MVGVFQRSSGGSKGSEGCLSVQHNENAALLWASKCIDNNDKRIRITDIIVFHSTRSAVKYDGRHYYGDSIKAN